MATIQELEAKIAALEAANQELERELAAHQQLVDDLRQSEAKFVHAFNCNAALLSISTFKDGRFLEVNDAFCQMFGYTRAEVIGKTSRELNLWIDYSQRELITAALQRDGTVCNWEVETRAKNGDQHIGLFSADLIMVHGEPYVLVTINDITERKRAEEALRQSEDKFARAFNASASLMGISTMREGRYIEVNDEFCRVLGYTRAEVIGKTSRELNILANYNQRDVMLEKLQRNEMVRNQEVELLTKNGDRRIGLFSPDIIMIQGEPHLLATVNDITERKRIERLLHIQRDLAVALNATSHLEAGARLCLNAALDASGLDSGGVYVLTDATGDLDLIAHTGFLLSAFVEMIKHAPAGAPNHALVMAGKPIYSQYLLEARPINAIRLHEGLQALAVIPLQHEGHVIGSLNIASHTSPEVPAYARDVLETIAAQIGNALARLKAESLLAQSEHAYRTLANNALVGIYKTTRAGAFLYANPAMLRMIEYDSLSDLQQHQVTDFYQDVQQRKLLLNLLEKTGGVEDFEMTIMTKHGRRKQVILSATLEGELLSGTMFDISERKQADAEIRRLNAELETRVLQRTAELEAANRELKDFAHIVSHDLKAPLRAINQLCQWLLGDYAAAFDEKGKEIVDMLIQRVKRMDGLIVGILEYSRVGRVVGEMLPVDLNSLIQDVIESVAPPPHIHITTQPMLPTVFGDKTRLFQVFQNLFSNAIRFMDKPDGQISVECQDAGAYWRMCVSDNGLGIDPRYHERIFQIFQTLHSRDDVDSTGVGLAIVKKIVEFYGGQVGVESSLGKGSAFWLTWPKSVST